ncbi:glutamate racemase [Candidatus Saccharibacteria bacterium]|nr:glutamate racemase [Candidatus Saccharibacteria bacterium]
MIIGIFDSGSGGRTVEAEVKKLLPDAKIIYLADTSNLPYGEKTPAELCSICERNVKSLIAQGAEIIIVACNTATTVAINYLRKKFPKTPIVGTEPAIKKACEESSASARILLLATEATTHSPRTLELIRLYRRPTQKVILQSCPGLADAIETNNQLKISELLSTLTQAKKHELIAPETVILGCTHYPLISPQLQAVFPTSRLVDGSLGVAQETARLANQLRIS